MPAPAIDRIALRLAGSVNRRRFAAGAAAAVLLAAGKTRAHAGITAACPVCGQGEICIDGVCVIAVEDGCEAFGCPEGLICADGACIDPTEEPITPPAPTPAPGDPPRRRKRRRRRRARPAPEAAQRRSLPARSGPR